MLEKYLPLTIDESDRCPSGGGHQWRETDEEWRDGRPVQVLACSRCKAELVGYLEAKEIL